MPVKKDIRPMRRMLRYVKGINMSESLSYFGVDSKNIRKNCIICPLSDSKLFDAFGKFETESGLFAKTENYEKATVISTKNNFLIGDAVLSLKNTLCENIILFGGCGAVGNIKIADKFIVQKAFNLESFSQMLEMRTNPDAYYPSKLLLEEFLSKNLKHDMQQIKCATTSSLILEKMYKDWFNRNKISAVDMECSSVFSAASSINKKAIAVFYVTDNINGFISAELDDSQKKKLLNARLTLAKYICDFINNG